MHFCSCSTDTCDCIAQFWPCMSSTPLILIQSTWKNLHRLVLFPFNGMSAFRRGCCLKLKAGQVTMFSRNLKKSSYQNDCDIFYFFSVKTKIMGFGTNFTPPHPSLVVCTIYRSLVQHDTGILHYDNDEASWLIEYK